MIRVGSLGDLAEMEKEPVDNKSGLTPREQLQRIFDAAREMGRTDITLKCADETCYREICRVLIDEQEIFSYIPDSNSTISYAQNGKQLSLTFWVTNE